ncbi:hypothetical protein N9K29_00885 [Candidatus Pelagibacter sp.]|nr:hypothetical protein [Candidatus Pelagibacter sp.]
MLRILIIILLLLPTTSNADQGLNISCINMKSVLGRKYDPLKFTLQAVGLQYLDEKKDKFVMIEASKLDIGEDYFTARFADYELGFQMVLFEGETESTMTMSKYDYKNKKFLEHYKCNVEMGYIKQTF